MAENKSFAFILEIEILRIVKKDVGGKKFLIIQYYNLCPCSNIIYNIVNVAIEHVTDVG